jgi:hypothetical protein
VEKLLTDAQIQLSVVASDNFGVSGRAMMAALVAGQRDPRVLAQMARARMRAKLADLEEAFHGRFTDHHAFLLARMLARIDALDTDIAAVETRIEDLIAPFADAVEPLDAIPGVGATAAQVIVAEVGTDMSRFPTAGHLAPVVRPSGRLRRPRPRPLRHPRWHPTRHPQPRQPSQRPRLPGHPAPRRLTLTTISSRLRCAPPGAVARLVTIILESDGQAEGVSGRVGEDPEPLAASAQP